MVERLLHTQEVAGSNPASRTIPPHSVEWHAIFQGAPVGEIFHNEFIRVFNGQLEDDVSLGTARKAEKQEKSR